MQESITFLSFFFFVFLFLNEVSFVGLSSIREEPLVVKEDINRRKVERARRISKRATSQIGLPHNVGVAEIQCGGPTKRDRYSKFSSLDFIYF